MNTEFRIICPSCSGHLVYPSEAHGQTVPCPHCGQPVCLEGDAERSGHGGATLRSASKATLWASIFGLLLVVGGLGWWLGQRSHTLPVSGASAASVGTAKDSVLPSQATNSSPAAEGVGPVPRPSSPPPTEAAKPMEVASTPVPMTPTNASSEASSTHLARTPASMPSNASAALRALWGEADHAEIKLTQVGVAGAYLKHRGRSLFVKAGELPDWLQDEFDKQLREDGERQGLIREVNGKSYDLRGTNPGWVNLSGRIIQIERGGYLVVDPRAVANGTAAFGVGVFHLLHNGLLRVFVVGEQIQIKAMSVGTVVYRNDSGSSRNIPVYDPGLPVGALREKVITMNGLPSAPTARKPGEPIGSGSGFFISEDGHFVTNAHVVEQASRLEVQHGTNTRPAIVVAVDKERDLALLQVQAGTNRMPFLVVSDRVPGLGEAVFTIGYPLLEIQGTKPKYTDGKISSLSGIRDDPKRMQISVPVQPGNSGGPLADSNGDVVGMVSARLNDLRVLEAAGSVPQNVNYAIKGSVLWEFLSSQQLPALKHHPGPSASRRSPEEAIKLVEKASGIVLIYAPTTKNSEPIRGVAPALTAKLNPPANRPPEPPPTPIRLEAEQWPILEQQDCKAVQQPMTAFGAQLWSGGKQLFCGSGARGLIAFNLPVERAGRYRLDLFATVAPDFGTYQVSINGQNLGSVVDGFGRTVRPANRISLGPVQLAAGNNRLQFQVTGKNPLSTGYYMGLDCVDLIPVAP